MSSSIKVLSGIGPTYKKLLEKLEIYTVEDLLHHYPFRYEDFSSIKKIADLVPEETVTLEGTLIKIDNIFTKNGKKITKAKLVDDTGELELVWFNQHYIKKTLTEGAHYRFSGKVQGFNKKLSLIAPKFEEVQKDNLNTGRLVAVYSEVKGLSSSWLRSKIKYVLESRTFLPYIDDPLPPHTLEQNNLLSLRDALSKIHFPENMSDIEAARSRLAFDELLKELLNVEQRRSSWEEEKDGIVISSKEYEQKIKELEKTLSFKLSKSQDKAIEQILEDINTTLPMNRLLEGDVGSGKTMVALFVAYVTHLAGYKTLYMAPTEILAQQQFKTFQQYLSDLGVTVKLSTGKSSTDLNDIDNAIIVGTHALLYTKEPILNVGLVVIDEQHRFGVEQRAKIIKLGTNDKKPNVLTMTATPIPRTLALTIYGDLDISALDALPHKSNELTTKVVPENMRNKTFEWIKKEGLQTFIVCPFITPSTHESFENIKAAEDEYLKLKDTIFPTKQLGLLHGRMKQDEKEEVLRKFRNGELTALVSTPVIEVGVDIPDASVMVIESAERYGLASLHQLRGRVGRAGQKAYCFLFMSRFTHDSYARLKHLEEISSGLKLSEIDMKHRGQGDMFGTMQHGFKQFKLASLDDVKLIELVQKEARKLYKDIEKYPKLKAYINQKTAYIESN